MAQVKYCDKCHEKISIREMPNGVWLPFDYQTNDLHECKEIKTTKKEIKDAEKTPKQEIVDNAIKEKSTLIFHDAKHNTQVIIPSKMINGYVTGYNYLDKQVHIYLLKKMYYIKAAEPSEVEIIKKEHKVKTYGFDYIILRKEGHIQIIKFNAKINYNIIFSYTKSKQDVANRISYIEFLMNIIKDKIDMTKLGDYSLVNLDNNDNLSLDILFNQNTFTYMDEIYEEERINRELSLKKIEEERKQQELERVKMEKNNRLINIMIGIIIAILLFNYFK